MATIGNTVLTMADWASRMDGGDRGKNSIIVEALSQDNEILEDMLVMMGNMPNGHRSVIRTGLPTVYWRMINQGVPISKSTTAPVMDTIGNLEAESQIDVDLLKINGNSNEFRMMESMAFVQAMSQQMAETLFYGNGITDPQAFTGLVPRYNTTSTSTAQSAANVIDAGGTGSDNTSIWFVTWGMNTTHGIFPKGQDMGLVHTPISDRWRVLDSNNNPYYAAIDHFKWNLGLVVRDWRYNVRIANIDVSDLAGGSPANLINLLIRGANLIPTTNGRLNAVTKSDGNGISGMMGRTVIYVNRTVRTWLEIQANDKTNVYLQNTEWDGVTVLTFRGIPIKTADRLLDTEAQVT